MCWVFSKCVPTAGMTAFKEKFIMDTNQADNFLLYPNTTKLEVKLSYEDGSSTVPCQTGVQTVFHSTTSGRTV